MIEIDNLPYATDLPKITIKPSNKLFKELGHTNYTFLDLISELIDNSISVKIPDRVLQIDIEIGLSRNDKALSYLIIKDNGKGISRDLLDKALSPGEIAGSTALNEHGLGMKQAIAALGELKYLATKTHSDDQAIVIEEIAFGEISPRLAQVDWPFGTEICVHHLKNILPVRPQDYTMRICPYLGARYRRYLKDKSKLQLTIEVKNLDRPGTNKIWPIRPFKPVYFHPITKQYGPVIYKHPFNGRRWKAELTFGYAPANPSEYKELDLQPPKQYEPYRASLSKQGFDILRNDRVISFHQLSEIGLTASRQSRYNLINGEIDLLKGFTTTLSKNDIVRDFNFMELITQLKGFIQEKKLFDKKTCHDLPKSLLIDRLVQHLKTRNRRPIKDIRSPCPVNSLGDLDILADGEAWQIKTQLAGALQVYELFAFMDMGAIEKGWLVAPDFESNANEAVQFIKSHHQKDIHLLKLVKKSKLPISQAPSLEEFKKHF